MQNFSISPKEMAASLWRNRGRVKALVQREVIGRYCGSVMGILWSVKLGKIIKSKCRMTVASQGGCHVPPTPAIQFAKWCV